MGRGETPSLWATSRLCRPLSRLRGRAREGEATRTEQAAPPPKPSPASGRGSAGTERIYLNPLDRQRNPLADADAHGGERAFSPARLQRVRRGEREARARHAERMPER